MKKIKKTHKILILLIIILGFFLRIYRINSIPPGFFCDEAIRGLDAYLILTTGHDSHGERYPLFPKNLGEYTPPLQTYSQIIPVSILGLNETSVRLTSVIYGTLSIFLIYILAANLISQRVGLISALLLAITPWAIHYNRIGFELNTYSAFFLLVMLLATKVIKNPKFLILFSLVSALTFYTYYPAFLTVWLLLAGFTIIHRKTVLNNKNIALVSLAIFIVIAAPAIKHTISGKGLVRFNQVSIFNKTNSINQIVAKAANNYLYHYSPNFLFLKGDPDVPNNRHFNSGLTPLLITTFPFLVIGVLTVIRIKSISKTNKQIILAWAIIYPFSGVLTSIISTNRAIIGVGLFTLLTAIGIEWLISKVSRFKFRYALQLFIFTVIWLNFLSFYNFYTNSYPRLTADFWGWQYGPREIMKYFLKVKDGYDDLYMSGEFNSGSVFLKFYDPKNTCQGKCRIGDFWRDPKIIDPLNRQLFSLSPHFLESSRMKDQFQVKHNIYYPDGEVAFVIGELTP